MKAVVVGGGSWGSVFAALLAERGHEVTLACRDPEEARIIDETGRNPRYITDLDLSGVAAAPLADAPIAGADQTGPRDDLLLRYLGRVQNWVS